MHVEYRSAIFFRTPEQETIARRVTQEVQEKHFTPKDQKIVTKINGSGALVRCRGLSPRRSVQESQWVPVSYAQTSLVTADGSGAGDSTFV